MGLVLIGWVRPKVNGLGLGNGLLNMRSKLMG